MKLISLFVAYFTFMLGYPCFAEGSQAIDFLKKLVEIESGTAQVKAVNQVQEILSKRLTGLGFQVSLKQNPLGENRSGNLLVATLRGENPKYVNFLLHADTVFEPAVGFKGLKIRDDQKIATGPGVIDDKGGMVIVLNGLERYLAAHPHPLYSLRVIVSPSEETGSDGFHDVFRKLSEDTAITLGFEPALDAHTIIDSRQGNRWYHIRVTGREAHAGRAHKEGINACLDLSQKLFLISKLSNYKKDVTVSIGHMEGGKDKFNIVCGTAEAKVDVRFTDMHVGDEVDQKIRAILKKPLTRAASDDQPTVTQVEIVDDCPGFRASLHSIPLIKKYRSAIEAIETIEIKSGKSGGSADSNYFTQNKTPVLDGLGAVGGKMHTSEEFLDLSSLETRAQALAKFLSELNSLP